MPAVNKPIDLKPVEAQAANMSAPSMVAAASAQTPTSAPASAAAHATRPDRCGHRWRPPSPRMRRLGKAQRRRGTPHRRYLSAQDRSRDDAGQDRRREPTIPDPSANRGRGGMTTYTTPTTQPAPPYGGPPAVPPHHAGGPPVMPRRRRRRTGIVAAAGALVIAVAATVAAMITLTGPVTPAKHIIDVVPPPPVTYSSTEIQAAKDTACSAWDKAARSTAVASKSSAASLSQSWRAQKALRRSRRRSVPGFLPLRTYAPSLALLRRPSRHFT